MVTPPTSCSSADFEQYLRGRLDEAAQAQLESHLDACVACRETLQKQAADDEFWQAAEASLGNAAATAMLPAEPAITDDQQKPAKDAVDPLEFIRSWLGPTDDPHMIGRLGGYEIAGVIGYGGMGLVLKGFDRGLNRFVAVKVLSPHLAPNGAARQRFAREARAAAAVVHENVVSIHAVDEWKSLPYLVMSYVRGESLQRRIDRQGQHSTEEVLRIAHQIAAGLDAAHTLGLVHRDIKPANILLEERVDRLWITDFGLARASDDANMTTSGVIVGTPQYMSPEQIRGESIDHRSDLFSLGSVLYTLCAGHPPFRAETTFGVMRRVTDEHSRPIRESNPRTPRWLCRIIERLHEKDPGLRYESAGQLARELESCLAHLRQPDVHALPHDLSVERESDAERLPDRSCVSYATLGIFLAMLAGGVALMSAIMPGSRRISTSEQEPALNGANVEDGLPKDTSTNNRSDVAEQMPPMDVQPELPFRYLATNQTEFAYRVTMVAELEYFEASLDGLIVYTVESREGDQITMLCESALEVRDTYMGRGLPPQHAWSHPLSSLYSAHGDRQTRITINGLGEVLQREGDCELPYRLGALPAIPFQPLSDVVAGEWVSTRPMQLTTFVPRSGVPVFVTSASDRYITSANLVMQNRTTSRMPPVLGFEQSIEVVPTGASRLAANQVHPPFRPPGRGHQPASIDFTATGRAQVRVDTEAGLIESYELEQTSAERENNLTVTVPVRLTLTLLTAGERTAFENERKIANDRERKESQRPLTAQEKTELIRDLAANRKVLNWLQRIAPIPVENIDQDIVDAILLYRDHADSAHRAQAEQILSKVPYEELDPFRVVE